MPWTTCPDALAALDDLRGHDGRQPFSIDARAKSARHCTHLFDLARLGLDHLRLDLPSRDYRISVAGLIEREHVADVGAPPTCISFQPGVRTTARRVRGSARDFTGRADELLADLRVEPSP